MTTSTPKVESEIHQASRLFLPWFKSSPRLGVSRRHAKAEEIEAGQAPMAPAISKGIRVTTGVRLLGSMWRRMIFQLLWPSARAART